MTRSSPVSFEKKKSTTMLPLPPSQAWLVPDASCLHPFLFVAPLNLLAPLCDHLWPFIFIHIRQATAAHVGSSDGQWSTPENSVLRYASQSINLLAIAYEWTFNLKNENLKSSLGAILYRYKSRTTLTYCSCKPEIHFANFLVHGWNLKKMVSICQSVPNFCLIHSNANCI